MFGQILDLILFPIKELLKLLVDDRITSYLGISPMAIIVTCVITLIVIKALVNTTYVGLGINRSIDSISQTVEANSAAKSKAKELSDWQAHRAQLDAAARSRNK